MKLTLNELHVKSFKTSKSKIVGGAESRITCIVMDGGCLISNIKTDCVVVEGKKKRG